MTPVQLPPSTWPTIAPSLPTIPTPESAIIDQAAAGEEIVVEKPAPSGITPFLLGAGGGFLVGGPIGAVIGAVAAGALTRKKAPPPPVAGFGGFWSSVRKVGRAVDITSSKSILGKVPLVGQPLVGISRQATAIAAVGATGGAILFARPDLGGKAVRGLMTGAQAGLALLTGSPLAAGATLFGRGAAEVAGPPPAETLIQASAAPGGDAMTAIPVDSAGQPIAKPPASGLGVAAAGAGAGFLVGGPIGAVVGGVAGMILGRRK